MIVTTLNREGLPLIRYRTRDITAVISRETCSCGRTSMRVKRIRGRNDDMLKIKGVNFYPTQLESILLQHNELASHYQIVLEKTKGRDVITVMIETYTDINSTVAEKIDMEIFDMLGFHIDKFNFMAEGTLPRIPGKAVRVVDHRES